MEKINVLCILLFLCSLAFSVCPPVNLSTPTDGSIINSSLSIFHNWTNLSWTYQANYTFCYNSTSTWHQICYTNLTGANITLTMLNGSIINWAVYPTCWATMENGSNSSVFQYTLGTSAVLPPLPFYNLDFDAIMLTWWAQNREWWLAIFSAAISYMITHSDSRIPNPLSLSVAGLALACLTIWALWFNPLYAGLGIVCLIISLILRQANR